jgi:hypothetical protein
MWSRNYLPFRVICVHTSLMEGLVVLFFGTLSHHLDLVLSFIVLLLYRQIFPTGIFLLLDVELSNFVVSGTLIYICSILNSFSNKYLRWQNTTVVLSRKSNIGSMLLWKVWLSIGFWMSANICLHKYYIPLLNDQSFFYWRKLCR